MCSVYESVCEHVYDVCEHVCVVYMSLYVSLCVYNMCEYMFGHTCVMCVSTHVCTHELVCKHVCVMCVSTCMHESVCNMCEHVCVMPVSTCVWCV